MMKMRTNINDVFIKEARALKSDVGELNCDTSDRGAAVYDLSESSFVAYSQKLSDDKKFDGAVQALNKNLGFFPKSTRTLNALSNAYMAKGDKESSISYLERTLSIDPQNRLARQLLSRIREGK